MAHISLPEGLPGIRGLFGFRPETAKPLCELADILLHAPGTLSLADRELIAAYVSSQNDCYYCHMSHGAIAANHLGGDDSAVSQVKSDFEHAPITDKLKALLAIADKVRQGGKKVLPDDIARAREAGATDQEIHDTVLIAAAFCMYNRYVDGLATFAPPDPESYRERAAVVANEGYLQISKKVAASGI